MALILMVLAVSAFVGGLALRPVHAGTLSNQICISYGANPVLNYSGLYHWHFTSNGVTYNQTAYSTTPGQVSVMALNGGYLMWIGGTFNNISGIFRAQSSDAISWNVDPTPVLKNGSGGVWDRGAVYAPSVLWNGSMYLMYFTGTNGSIYSRSIGVAFSIDTVHWTEYKSDPVVRGGPDVYDSWWARFPTVIYDNGTYRMWYTAHSYITDNPLPFLSIAYATSPDGLHWTKYPGNPVVGGRTTFAQMPSVVKINDSFLMAYSGEGPGISYAFSRNGINWTQPAYQLVAPDNSYVIWPDLLLNGTQLLMWYNEQHSISNSSSWAGISLASCSFAFIFEPLLMVVSTTGTVYTASPTTVTSTHVSAVTQTVTSTTVSTTPSLVGLPTTMLEVATAGTVVTAAALVALVVLRLASRRSP